MPKVFRQRPSSKGHTDGNLVETLLTTQQYTLLQNFLSCQCRVCVYILLMDGLSNKLNTP